MGAAVRPFRFGVVGEGIRSGEELLDEARWAEAFGYGTLVLRDHFVPEPFGEQLAPMVALTAAAAATRTLRVGTLVLDNDYRHPVLLAKEVATLDALSGGRFELGIGAGWLREEYQRADIPFDPPGVRVERLEESVRLLKGLLSGAAVSFHGKHYSVDGIETFPRPVQRPRPPILVGAGSRRMLGIAGREADVVGILPKALPDGTISEDLEELSPETLARKVDWVRQAAADRAGEVELSMLVGVKLADDHRAAAEQVATRNGWGAAAGPLVERMPSILVGSVDRIAEQVEERRERFGMSYLVVSDRHMERFAPVVERLAGK